MRRLMVLAASLAVLLVGVAAASSACGEGATQGRWVIQDLGTLGGPSSEAIAINDRGQVVGWADTSAEDRFGRTVSRAFLWQNGNMRDLGTFGGPSSSVDAINDRGQVVGSADTKATTVDDHGDPWPVIHAFLWQNGKMADLGTLGGPGSWVFGINERGRIIGGSETKSGATHAFLWQNGRMRDLGVPPGERGANAIVPSALNARGQVVGTSYEFAWFGRDAPPPKRKRAFLWQNGKMRDLGTFGGKGSQAEDISDRGQVVGSADTKAKNKYGEPVEHAFLWQNGTMRDIGTLGTRGWSSYAHAISERGQVVGDGGGRAFLWQNGKMRDLGTLGGPGSSALDINERGQVVGSADTKAKGEYDIPITQAFLWENDKITQLPLLPAGKQSRPVAINNRGWIIGTVTMKSGDTRAVLWTYKP